MCDARFMDRPANDLRALGTKAIAGEDDTGKRSRPSRERNGEIEGRKVESTMFSRFNYTSHRISVQQQAVTQTLKISTPVKTAAAASSYINAYGNHDVSRDCDS